MGTDRIEDRLAIDELRNRYAGQDRLKQPAVDR
jgi:hypothetical protein